MTPAPAVIPSRELHPAALEIAHLLLKQHRELPRPTSILVEDALGGRTHVTLTVDTPAQVDAWAEAMNVDVDSEQHADGTWTDQASGALHVIDAWNQGQPLHEELVGVTVYVPLIGHQGVAS